MLPLARLIKRGESKKQITSSSASKVVRGAKTFISLTKLIVQLLVQPSRNQRRRKIVYFGKPLTTSNLFLVKKLIAQFFSTQSLKPTTWWPGGYNHIRMITTPLFPVTQTFISYWRRMLTSITASRTSSTHSKASWTKEENR